MDKGQSKEVSWAILNNKGKRQRLLSKVIAYKKNLVDSIELVKGLNIGCEK